MYLAPDIKGVKHIPDVDIDRFHIPLNDFVYSKLGSCYQGKPVTVPQEQL